MSAIVTSVKITASPAHRHIHASKSPIHEQSLQTSGAPCSPICLSAPRTADRHSYNVRLAIHESSAFLNYSAYFIVRLSTIMFTTATSTYFLPAILLNPVLFLHSLNTILSRILPPVVAAAEIQPLPYYNLGPSANYPHLDCHASDSFCWGYTILIVSVQLLAFGRISQSRAEVKERRQSKDTAILASTRSFERRKGNAKSSNITDAAAKPDGTASIQKEDLEWWED